MKKLFLLILALFMGALLVGCGGSGSDDEDDDLGPVTTVMYYEVGDEVSGSDLSQGIKDTIKLFGQFDTEEVNIVCQFKLNESDNVYRGIVEEEGDDWSDYPVISSGKMTTGESLDEFIHYAKKNCPADNYVLVIGGHGSGYDTTETKGIVYHNDGSFMTNGTIGEVCKSYGIQACICDASFMGCFENLQCCYDAFKYIVVSEHNADAYSMYNLVSQLITFEDLETALGVFVKKQGDIYGNNCDVKLVDTKYYSEVVSSVKKITDFLNNNFAEYKDEINTAHSMIKPMGNNNLVDFVDFIITLQPMIASDEFDNIINEYRMSEENCFIYNHTIGGSGNYGAGYGFSVSFPNKEVYDRDYKNNYPNTLFAQATGWDKLLSKQEN